MSHYNKGVSAIFWGSQGVSRGNAIWAVLWSEEEPGNTGNSLTFHPSVGYDDTTDPDPAPNAYVIHSRITQAQHDELALYQSGGTPARWLGALSQGYLDTVRGDCEFSLGDGPAIDAAHGAFVAGKNLVPSPIGAPD